MVTKKDFSLLNDRLFLDVFGRKENIRFIEYFLECFFGYEEGSLKGKGILTFETTEERENVESKTNRCDILYETENQIINLELYQVMDEYAFWKSFIYLICIANNRLGKQEKYKEKEKFIQINLVGKMNEKVSNVFEQCLTILPLTKYFEIHIIRLDLIGKVGYNRNRNKEYEEFLRYLKASPKERKAYEKRKGVYKEMNKEIERRLSAGLRREDFDHDMWEKRRGIGKGEKIGKSEGISIGKSQGMEIEKTKIAKNLIKENIPISLISRSTGLKKEKIEKLRLELAS